MINFRSRFPYRDGVTRIASVGAVDVTCCRAGVASGVRTSSQYLRVIHLGRGFPQRR